MRTNSLAKQCSASRNTHNEHPQGHYTIGFRNIPVALYDESSIKNMRRWSIRCWVGRTGHWLTQQQCHRVYSQHANREALLKEIRRNSKVNISRGLHIVILNVNTKLSKNAHVYTNKQDRQCTYKVTLRRVRELYIILLYYYYYIIIHFPESARACVGMLAQSRAFARVGLLIQHATRMRHIVCGICLHHKFLKLFHKRHSIPEKSYWT